MSEIPITLNGEPRTVEAGQTVCSLLRSLGFEPGKVAIERNLEIVPRSLYKETAVEPGDRLEVVHFIGGGL